MAITDKTRKLLWASRVADSMVASPCSSRSIHVRTKSRLCGGADLHDRSAAGPDPWTVGGPATITPVFSHPLLLGEAPRKAMAQLDARHCLFHFDDPSSAGTSRWAIQRRPQVVWSIKFTPP